MPHTAQTRLGSVAVAAFAVVAAILALSAMKHGDLLTGDSQKVVRGVHLAFSCLGHGHLTKCGTVAEGPKSVGPFPLLQYLPAAVLVAAGANLHAALQGLAWVNLACFGVLIGLIFV